MLPISIRGLAVLPFVAVTLLLVKYHVDVPFGDEWNLIPLLDHFYDARLSLRDFWAPFNEHHCVFPKILFVLIAGPSRWHPFSLTLLSLSFAVLTFGIWIHQLSKTQQAVGRGDLRWTIPILSLLIFSLWQWLNWLMGWQFSTFLCLSLVTAVMVILFNPGSSRRPSFLAAVVLAIAASFSTGSGLVVWPVGLLLIPLTAEGDRRLKLKRTLGWLLTGALVIGVYFFDYRKPPHHPSLLYGPEHPFELILYVLAYVSSPVIGCFASARILDLSLLAPLTGAAGILGFLRVFYLLQRNLKVPFTVFLPYVGMALFTLGCALLTGFARVGMGFTQALSSRYVTYGIPFWGALAVLCFLALKTTKIKGIWGPLCFGFFILATGLNSAAGATLFARHYQSLTPARTELDILKDAALLKRLHPDLPFLKRNVPLLKKHRLSLYRQNR